MKDSKGYFCRWGSSGKKYYYNPNDKASRERARKKANKQGAAARASGWTGKAIDDTEVKASDIQSLRFTKSKFSRVQAVSWAKSHGFKSSDVDETSNQYRLRQFPPDRCLRSGGIKEISEGVQAYICPIKGTKSDDEIEVESKSIGEDDFDYVIPKTIEELQEGHIVKYKDKIGKIVKVIGDVS